MVSLTIFFDTDPPTPGIFHRVLMAHQLLVPANILIIKLSCVKHPYIYNLLHNSVHNKFLYKHQHHILPKNK